MVGLATAILATHPPTEAATARIKWRGYGSAILGHAFSGTTAVRACGGRAYEAGRVVVATRRHDVVTDVWTRSRGIHGPHKVVVGHKSRARTKLVRGPHGRTLWIHARHGRIDAFGIALNRKLARSAIKHRNCAPQKPAQPKPTPVKPPVCPTTLPVVGPYMSVACGATTGNRVQKTCYADWLDTDAEAADGCEVEAAGLQTVYLHTWSTLALADHVTGSFMMGGYGPDQKPYPLYSAPATTIIPVVPVCDAGESGNTIACPGGEPSDPAPELTIDLALHPGDEGLSRSVIAPTGDPDPVGLAVPGAGPSYSQATTTARFRLSSTSSIPVTVAGVDCSLTINTTPGARQDLELDGQLDRATDPETGDGQDGPLRLSNVTLTNLEASDYSISGSSLCQILSPETPDEVSGQLLPSLTAWYRQVTRLCGAEDPYWWQPCPSSVHVSW